MLINQHTISKTNYSNQMNNKQSKLLNKYKEKCNKNAFQTANDILNQYKNNK